MVGTHAWTSGLAGRAHCQGKEEIEKERIEQANTEAIPGWNLPSNYLVTHNSCCVELRLS